MVSSGSSGVLVMRRLRKHSRMGYGVMDLKSASGGAFWHPLTSLIQYQSTASTRELVLLPVIELSPRSAYSTLLHEVTHKWCARTTRLGYLMARTAGELMLEFAENQDTSLSVRDNVISVLAAYTPLLEGLAMYTELDYTTDREVDLLASPLSLITSMLESAYWDQHLSREQLLEMIRNEARSDDVENSISIAETLFLDTSKVSCNYYCLGYLYIKSLQSLFRARCESLGQPRLFLPLAMKLICDSPLLDETLDPEKTIQPHELLEKLHGTLISISSDDLRAYSDLALGDAEFQYKFDHWSPYPDIVGTKQHPYELGQPNYPGVEMLQNYFPIDQEGLARTTEEEPLVQQIMFARGSASVFLLAWEHGQPKDFNLDSIGSLAPLLIPRIEDLDDQIPVTFANFMTLTDGTAGLAMWVDDQLVGLSPIVGNSPPDDLERAVMSGGLQQSPRQRQRFAAALEQHPSLSANIRSCGNWLASQLISDAAELEMLQENRLYELLSPHAGIFRTWCQHDPDHDESVAPAECIEAGERVFDFPGFDGSGVTLHFSNLLPRF